MGQFIPLSIPNFEGNERKYVDDAVAQGWVSTGGAYIKKLEEQLAAYLHVPQVAACQSGTSALHLALRMCEVQPGDLVITPTVTFIAAVNPVRYQFADPIFMDCDDSLCMDPVKLRTFCRQECELQGNRLIYKKNGRQIKALIVVHVFGNIADMEQIMDIAHQYQLKVIEDATEALGSLVTEGRYAGRYAGTIGDFGAYSFNGNKIITTGGGGAVTARNEKDVEHMRYLSTQAKDDVHYYIHNEVGYNYRMTNVQAALGVAQMEYLEAFVERKRKNYERYAKALESMACGELMPFREGTRSNCWFYAFRLNRDVVKENLREIIAKFEKHGIQTRAIWGLIHQQQPYQDSVAYKIEKAQTYQSSVINLPCSTQLTEAEISVVVETLKNFFML